MTTEKTYVSLLETMQSVYIDPLTKSASHKDGGAILSMDEIQLLFPQLSIICGLNKAFLQALQERLGAEQQEWNDTVCISDIFASYGQSQPRLVHSAIHLHHRSSSLLSLAILCFLVHSSFSLFFSFPFLCLLLSVVPLFRSLL